MANFTVGHGSTVRSEEAITVIEKLFCDDPCGLEKKYQHSRNGMTPLHFHECANGHRSASSTKYPNIRHVPKSELKLS